MDRIRRHRRPVRLASGALVALVLVAGLTGCKPKPDAYVALGDSYTAGPLIPDQSTDPLGCLRSDANYPSLAYPTVKATRFIDVSCSGAQTDDLYAEQDVTPGPPNPPQLDALDIDTKIVTMGMGGNDIGFSGIVQDCAISWPWEPGCKDTFVHDGRDEVSERIAETAPKIRQAVLDIKDRARRATVFVVGYPVILPDQGNGCYPLVPIKPSDVPYLREKEKELNAMLQASAAATGAHYIDLYTPSIGHDVCDIERWVEGLIPLSLAAPVHPNADGMEAFAGFVSTRINQVVTS